MVKKHHLKSPKIRRLEAATYATHAMEHFDIRNSSNGLDNRAGSVIIKESDAQDFSPKSIVLRIRPQGLGTVERVPNFNSYWS